MTTYAEARAYRCATCDARPGAFCISPKTGRKAERAHAERLALASEHASGLDFDTEISQERYEALSKRVEALFAKAESTTSEEEAAACFAKASELMLRYSIGRAEVQGTAKDPIVRVAVPFIGNGASSHMWRTLGRDGAHAIVHATGLVGFGFWNPAKTVALYGTAVDCEFVRSLLQSVWRQASHALALFKAGAGDEYWGKTIRFQRLAQLTFMAGFADAVATRIRESRRETVESITGSELILASRSADIEDAMKGLRQARTSLGGFAPVGYAEGVAAGRSAILGNEVAR